MKKNRFRPSLELSEMLINIDKLREDPQCEGGGMVSAKVCGHFRCPHTHAHTHNYRSRQCPWTFRTSTRL